MITYLKIPWIFHDKIHIYDAVDKYLTLKQGHN